MVGAAQATDILARVRATRAMTAMLMTVALCLALAACGGGDGAAGDAAPARSSTAPAATASGLGAERFAALDAVYVAQVPLDELEDDADPSDLTRASQPLVQACNALDAEDPLLGPLRRLCPVLTRFTEQLQGFGTCASEGADACEALIDEVRTTLGDFTRLSRRGDAAIKRAELTSWCETALLTPALGYEVVAGYRRAFELLDRGLTGQADRALAAADAKAERLPDGAASLRRFRRGCR